ncbi:MAG: hypothetical protein JWP88_75 [Flaviaesturariibacter sp.]|nr:hypothetical protein [Flaviaesturariibacter sp.]
MRSILLFLLFAVFVACNPYKALRNDSFTYTTNGVLQTIALKVPKGYTNKQEETDAAGNLGRTYRYSNGATLYFVYAANDTSFQRFDSTEQVARPQLNGGIFYKWQEPATERFWRTVFNKNMRFGYTNATIDKQEALLDSALNFVRVH